MGETQAMENQVRTCYDDRQRLDKTMNDQKVFSIRPNQIRIRSTSSREI